MINLLLLDTSLGALQGHWHWAASGVVIAIILILMSWMGRHFGVSSIFRDFCNIAGAGKRYSYFNIDLKDEGWRIAFIIGTVLGGTIAAVWLVPATPLAINPATIAHLAEWGIAFPATTAEGVGYLPDMFTLSNPKGVIIAIVGGFLVGFGARYADGCTSGHSITGMAQLQLPSLLTTIGFFIGGLIMTWLIMPLIFG